MTPNTVKFLSSLSSLSCRMQHLERESRAHGDMAVFTDSAALPESEHLLYQLGWLQHSVSYHFLLRTKDRYIDISLRGT